MERPLRLEATTGFDAGRIECLAEEVRVALGWDPRRVLSPFDAVVMTLQYWRGNVAQEFLAYHFRASQSTVSRTIRAVGVVLARFVREFVVEKAGLPATAMIVDGTLIPTGERRGRRDLFSGGRGRPGMNVQVLSDLQARLIAVSDPVPGSVGDITAVREWALFERLDNDQTLADRGYQGTRMTVPVKRRAGRGISEEDKRFNASLSRFRAPVERCISHLKNWKILSTGYRGRLAELPDLVRLLAGLERYRTAW